MLIIPLGPGSSLSFSIETFQSTAPSVQPTGGCILTDSSWYFRFQLWFTLVDPPPKKNVGPTKRSIWWKWLIPLSFASYPLLIIGISFPIFSKCEHFGLLYKLTCNTHTRAHLLLYIWTYGNKQAKHVTVAVIKSLCAQIYCCSCCYVKVKVYIFAKTTDRSFISCGCLCMWDSVYIVCWLLLSLRRRNRNEPERVGGQVGESESVHWSANILEIEWQTNMCKWECGEFWT